MAATANKLALSVGFLLCPVLLLPITRCSFNVAVVAAVLFAFCDVPCLRVYCTK